MITPLAVGSVLTFIGCATLIVTAWAFCARPASRELRIAREVALLLLTARVIGTEVIGLELDGIRGFFWIGLGVTTLYLAWFNVQSLLGPDGDRCE